MPQEGYHEVGKPQSHCLSLFWYILTKYDFSWGDVNKHLFTSDRALMKNKEMIPMPWLVEQ